MTKLNALIGLTLIAALGISWMLPNDDLSVGTPLSESRARAIMGGQDGSGGCPTYGGDDTCSISGACPLVNGYYQIAPTGGYYKFSTTYDCGQFRGESCGVYAWTTWCFKYCSKTSDLGQKFPVAVLAY